MQEPCRSCEFREQDWGGCRCQAFAIAGDATLADPACHKSEHHRAFAAIGAEDAAAAAPGFIFRSPRTAVR
jgi:PqqA peptide cyclase